MSHSQRIDSHNPALFVITVDQSGSMEDSIGGSEAKKSLAVAYHINNLLYELVLRCTKNPNEPPRPYFFVQVIGYGTDESGQPIVESLLTSSTGGLTSTTDLAMNPLRLDRTIHPSTGATVSMPIWILPRASGGTPMCAALNLAGKTSAKWIASNPNGFPPVVINLTDGESTDGDPQLWANRLRGLRTTDGELLLFNLSLSDTLIQPQLFPATAENLPDQFSKALFAMSSDLPPGMLASAQAQGLPVHPGAKGMACNSDLRTLATFMNVGTNMGRL